MHFLFYITQQDHPYIFTHRIKLIINEIWHECFITSLLIRRDASFVQTSRESYNMYLYLCSSNTLGMEMAYHRYVIISYPSTHFDSDTWAAKIVIYILIPREQTRMSILAVST